MRWFFSPKHHISRLSLLVQYENKKVKDNYLFDSLFDKVRKVNKCKVMSSIAKSTRQKLIEFDRGIVLLLPYSPDCTNGIIHSICFRTIYVRDKYFENQEKKFTNTLVAFYKNFKLIQIYE